jgi:iron complex outermembrane receptor protein
VVIGFIGLLLIFAPKVPAQAAATNGPSPSPEGPNAYKSLTLEQLMDLDVTSVARQPEPYGQAPAAIVVITGDDIARSGASSIPEALRLADNLEVAQKNSSGWAISARGFNTDLANKLLVMIDGRTVYTPLFSGVFWNAQDYILEDIDRIEVVSGPGGTLWGANAVNGVINITTKSAKDTQGFLFETGGGSWLEDFAEVRYGGAINSNVFYRVYGKYFDKGDEVFSNGKNAPDSWRMAQGGFRIDATASDQDNLTVQGDIYGSQDNMVTTTGPAGQGEWNGGNLLGRWTHTISEDSDTSLQLYYDRTKLMEATGLPNDDTVTDDLDTYDVDFQHRFKLGNLNNIVWGLGYRFTHDQVGESREIAFDPSTLDQNLFSGFLQDEIMLRANLFLTLGSKIEHNDYTGVEFEPSGRLQWNVTPNQTIWGAVSRAVRTPSRIDHDLREPNDATPILEGGSDFQSETVIAYELGYRAQLSEKVSGSLSLFYNDYDDVRSLSFTPGTIIPLFFANNLEGHTYGVELSASYQLLSWWRLHAGYDYLQECLHVKPGQVDLNHALNETADPKNQFQIRSSMDLPGNTAFDTALRWVDTLHNNNGPVVGTVPSYFELNARFAWQATKNVELSIVGENLLHDYHTEYGFPNSSQEAIERSVYAKVSYHW